MRAALEQCHRLGERRGWIEERDVAVLIAVTSAVSGVDAVARVVGVVVGAAAVVEGLPWPRASRSRSQRERQPWQAPLRPWPCGCAVRCPWARRRSTHSRSTAASLPQPTPCIKLVGLIVAAAHAFALLVVTERIENQHQTDRLLEVDAEYGQGFLYAHPMPAEARFGTRSLAEPAQLATG